VRDFLVNVLGGLEVEAAASGLEFILAGLELFVKLLNLLVDGVAIVLAALLLFSDFVELGNDLGSTLRGRRVLVLRLRVVDFGLEIVL
jgi:hypothetical protein